PRPRHRAPPRAGLAHPRLPGPGIHRPRRPHRVARRRDHGTAARPGRPARAGRTRRRPGGAGAHPARRPPAAQAVRRAAPAGLLRRRAGGAAAAARARRADHRHGPGRTPRGVVRRRPAPRRARHDRAAGHPQRHRGRDRPRPGRRPRPGPRHRLRLPGRTEGAGRRRGPGRPGVARDGAAAGARGGRAAGPGRRVGPPLDPAARPRGGAHGRRHRHRRGRLRRPRRLHAGHAKPGGRVPRAGRRRAAGAGEGVSTRAAASVRNGATTSAGPGDPPERRPGRRPGEGPGVLRSDQAGSGSGAREPGMIQTRGPSEGEQRDASVVPADVLPGGARGVEETAPGPAELGPRARLWPSLAAVYRAQLSRARVARIPLLFVATFQSVGIMILMRGVVDGGGEARAVVAGSSVLVVAFVALNLLAQYFGQLRSSGGLDHYATLPVPPAAVVLGAAGAYASFTVPGTVVTAVFGCVLFGLPLTHLWVLAAVIPLAGAALAGLGAALGLLAPRPELATLLGQLGMSAALLLGVLPAERMPEAVRLARDLLPSTYGVEAYART